jgi:hypothetical protein
MRIRGGINAVVSDGTPGNAFAAKIGKRPERSHDAPETTLVNVESNHYRILLLRHPATPF